MAEKVEKHSKKESVKISEFEWYEVENKVRQYMHDLLQPFQRKQIDESAKIAELKRQLATCKEKLSEHAFLLKESEDKPKIFSDMEEKLVEMQHSFQGLRAEQNKSMSEIQNKLQFYDQKMHRIDEVAATTESERVKRIEDKQQVLTRVDKEVTRLIGAVEAQNNDFNVLNSTFRIGLNTMQQKNLVNENRIKNFDNMARSITKDIDLVRDDMLKLDKKTNQNKYWLNDLQKRMDKLEDNNELSKKFIGVVDNIRNDFRFIETYISKYMPLFVQAQISDTLNSFVSGRNRKALCVYEQRIFDYYNQTILEGKGAGLDDNIRNYVETIEGIILRNRKFVIKLKVEKRVKLGNKQYDFHVLDAMEEDDNERKVQVEMTVPEDKIRTLVDEYWSGLSKDLSSRLNQHEKSSKVWLKEIQQFVDHRGMLTDNKIETLASDLEKLRTDYQLEMGYLKDENNDITRKIGIVEGIAVDCRQLTKELTHFSSIINHIIIQDEIDRQGIALYGLRDNQKQKQRQVPKQRPNIGLDAKCFGCSGFPASTLSAFKMACLAYNPSNVLVEGRAYRREQILEFGTKLLQNIKERLSVEHKPTSSVMATTPPLRSEFHGSHTQPPGRISEFKTLDTPNTTRMLPQVTRSRSRQSSGRRQLLFRKREKADILRDPTSSFYY